jgi:hypothetical protein
MISVQSAEKDIIKTLMDFVLMYVSLDCMGMLILDRVCLAHLVVTTVPSTLPASSAKEACK